MSVGADAGPSGVVVAAREADGSVRIGMMPPAGLGREEIVLAVPDAWLGGGADGARSGDTLWRVLAEGHGARIRQVVPRTVAAAASADPGPWLVVDAGLDAVTAAAGHRSGDGAVLLSGTRTVACPAPAAETRTLIEALADAGHARRAAAVLPRALTTPRYRPTPVYGRLTAGAVADLFAPIADALRRCLGALLGHGAAPPDTVDLIGALGPLPLTAAVIKDVTHAGVRPGAAAPGALRLAEGRARYRAADPGSLHLPVHRRRAGRLVTERIVLPAGRAGGADADGEPLVVEADGLREPTVEWTAAGAPGPRRVPLGPVPPGRYRVGIWPAHRGPGVLVLRPADGGEPRYVPLDDFDPLRKEPGR